MSIHINQDKSLFHLQTDHTSYIFNVLENGELGQLYYGPRLHDQAAYPNLAAREWRNANAAVSEDQPDLQPGVLKQEYASFGKGDFREPAFQVTLADGSRISEFAVTGYDVTPGKARLGALPSTFASDDDVTSLTIHLTDAWAKLALDLNYAVFPHQDVIVRSATFANQGQESVVLNRALSLQLDLPDSQYDLIQFSGSWARERHLFKNPIHVGTQGISSRRGSSSHQQNPFFLLTRPTTTEDAGAAFGFNLVYSGNFMDQVEVDQYDTTRILTGINPAEFGWTLAPEKQFQTPEAVMSYSHQGTNQLSQQLGDLYAKHLVNQNFAAKERPILVNNWEATQFDFTADKLLAFAQSAKKMGIEMLVLDDGWFGHRDDDTSSLGDWFVNAKKFPQGFKHLSDSVHDLGLKFGLWFEPEMISKDSNLYKTHPDWLIHAPGRTSSPERHQFVLDMTRPEVVAYLYDAMAKMIADNHIDYVKWDMNRNITEMYGAQLAPDQQLEFPHRYILGVYRLYDKLTQAFPDVLFESCASGGGRFDLGMMYYAPQAWTSDNTDAVERLNIQYSTSFGYPQAMMGAHVSAVPNDQNGRITSLATRGAVAYFGDLGYELDITQLSEADQAEITQQVTFYKQYRHLFQFGTFYRLQSPYENGGNVIAWQVVDQAQDTAIAARYQLLNTANAPYSRLYFKGLDPNKQYVINDDTAHPLYGDELMSAGYFLTTPAKLATQSADFNAQLFVAKAVKS